MKFKRATLAAVILLIGCISVRAEEAHLFFLHVAATLNGAAVPLGIYELSWESQGSAVRVTLRRYGKFIATAKGTWVKHDVKYTEDAALVRVNPDGSRSLVEIRLEGMKKSIVLETGEPVLHLAAK